MATPYYQPWYQPGNQMQAGQLKGRPVTSLEEVKGSTIEFDGSVFYFPDLANKRIYTKQINVDGTSTINMYELKPLPQPSVINPSQYVTREEFETVLQKIKQQMQNTTIGNGAVESAAGPVQSAVQQVNSPVQPAAPQTFNF